MRMGRRGQFSRTPGRRGGIRRFIILWRTLATPYDAVYVGMKGMTTASNGAKSPMEALHEETKKSVAAHGIIGAILLSPRVTIGDS